MTLYSAYVIDTVTKNELLLKFKPKYGKVFAHHVTYQFGGNSELPPDAKVEIVGYLDTTTGLEAFIVKVDGNKYRPDGRVYHITWSLDNGYKPYDSNVMIERYGWEDIEPIEIKATPTIISK